MFLANPICPGGFQHRVEIFERALLVRRVLRHHHSGDVENRTLFRERRLHRNAGVLPHHHAGEPHHADIEFAGLERRAGGVGRRIQPQAVGVQLDQQLLRLVEIRRRCRSRTATPPSARRARCRRGSRPCPCTSRRADRLNVVGGVGHAVRDCRSAPAGCRCGARRTAVPRSSRTYLRFGILLSSSVSSSPRSFSRYAEVGPHARDVERPARQRAWSPGSWRRAAARCRHPPRPRSPAASAADPRRSP